MQGELHETGALPTTESHQSFCADKGSAKLVPSHKDEESSGLTEKEDAHGDAAGGECAGDAGPFVCQEPGPCAAEPQGECVIIKGSAEANGSVSPLPKCSAADAPHPMEQAAEDGSRSTKLRSRKHSTAPGRARCAGQAPTQGMLSTEALPDPFAVLRPKRASSIKAQEKLVKRINMDRKADELVQVSIVNDAVFCGLAAKGKRSAAKRLQETMQSASVFDREQAHAVPRSDAEHPSAFSAALPTSGSAVEGFTMPIHKRPLGKAVLSDKTNSPAKGLKKEPQVSAVVAVEDTQSAASKFFLSDLKFLKPKKKTKSRYKEYLSVKKKNTHLNQGYATVSPRRKAVIDFNICPNSFYCTSDKPRLVTFSNEAASRPHNTDDEPTSILKEPAPATQFSWEAEKERVDIIRRVNLGSEFSFDDFAFTRTGDKIGS
ncbi:hypothetical protein PAPHI01_0026 [Pancytospora philotis]|nr:hypothetical protein PAPHI01_0026 [Pancytospora philotis]